MNTSFSDRKGVSDQSSYYVNLWAAVNSFLNPTSPLYEADGNYTECINNQYPNLVRERGMKVNNQKQYRLLLNPWAEFKWWDISFKSNNQLDFLNSLSQLYYPSNTNDGQAYEGLGQKLANQFYTLTSSNTVNYGKQLSENHYPKALLGLEPMAHKLDYT